MTSPTTNKAFKVYQASAGSGKTYTIVKEYLGLCLRSKADLSNFRHILAITFTNMAANEMKEKVLNQLLDIINSDPQEAAKSMEADLIKELNIERDELKSNAQELFICIIHNYSDFYICTIDAFVQRLARSFPKELRLPNQFNVSIDKKEVSMEITERIGEQIGADNEFLTHVIEDYSEKKFDKNKSPKVQNDISGFTVGLLSEDAFQKHEQNRFVDEGAYKEANQFLNEQTKPFEKDAMQFVADFEAFLKQYNLEEKDFNGISKSPCTSLYKKLRGNIYPILSPTLSQIAEGSKTWYHKDLPKKLGADPFKQVDEAFQKSCLPFIQRYRQQIGNYLFYKSQFQNLSLYVLRSKIKTELETYISEEQVVHISEFNKRINEILGDFSVPFIYERLGEHFKHLFIDEFQDTSVLQWQNLIPLIDNSLANKNMSMVVGDGKQSIYRWRNGEVEQITHLPEIYAKPGDATEAFNEYEQGFINNFNFNELKTNFRSLGKVVDFNNDLFRFAADLLPEEERSVYQMKENPYGKEVSIEQLKRHPEGGYAQIELFDKKDGSLEMMKRTQEIINDVLTKGFKKGDITILVRTNKEGTAIAKYLNENGIEVVSAESILLKGSNKVQLLISALNYLIHSDNAVAVANVLYYWHATRGNSFDGVVDGVFDQAKNIAKGKLPIEKVLELQDNALKDLMARSYSLYDLCASMIRLFGFNSLGDIFLNFFLNLVYQWQSAEEANIQQFLDYWEANKKDLAVVTGKSDAVSVMTIHKSKGLEFDVVICPFLKDNLNDSKGSSIWISPEDLGFEAIPNIDMVQFSITKDTATWSSKAQDIAELEDRKVMLDNLNIDYVAFTRAVQRLYVMAYQVKEIKNNPINKFFKDHPEPYGDPNAHKVALSKDKGGHEIEFFNESASTEWFDKISIDDDPSMYWMHPDDPMKPMEWGTFVHQVLSEVQHKDDIDRVLKTHVDSGAIDQATADHLRSLFEQMASHPVVGPAFSEQAKVKNECDILTREHGILRPDRFAELPDKIYLLDYKTGKKDKEHHEQLSRYQSVLRNMVDQTIEAYLVYLGDTIDIEKAEAV